LIRQKIALFLTDPNNDFIDFADLDPDYGKVAEIGKWNHRKSKNLGF